MLNEDILARLAAADREHQKEAGGRLLLRAVKYLFAAVGVAFVVDVILHLHAGWRLSLLLGLLGAVLALAGAAWYLAFVRRNRLEHIARFLEDRDPALGSQLINLLQLRAQTHDETLAPLTRELARQAIAGYSAQLRNTPLEQLAWTGELRQCFKRAGWATLIFLAGLAGFFRVTAVEMARFVDPFGDHPPYSFTRLEIVNPGPSGTNVLYGKDIVVKVKASGHQPREVFLTRFPPDHPEQAVTVSMFDKGRVGYDQLVNNVKTELILYAHTRDGVSVSKRTHLGVILTPRLEHAFVQVAPPPYTGIKAEEKPYAFKGIQALEGSEVRFRLQSNRPLRDGVIEIAGGEQPARRIVMTNAGPNEVAASFTARDSSQLRFSVVDVAGLPSQDDWEGPLTVTHDLAPEIHIAEPERDAVVAIDFKLEAHIDANDDYGLRTVRIHCGINGKFPEPRVVTYDSVVRSGHETLDLNFAALGARPGDVVSLFAEAIDTAPEPHLARSQTVRLQVISVEDYNNFLRERTDIADIEEKYQGLMDDLQELIDQQKKLGETAEKLKPQAAKAKPAEREDLTRQLDNLLAKQNELNDKLNKHADRMEHFVRETPVYDVETELQDLLREQAGEIRGSTKENDAVSKRVAQQSSPPGGRKLAPAMPEELKKASDEQVRRLGGVNDETQKEVAQTLEDMSLMQELQKDFGQFEALYEAQKELAAQSQAYNRSTPPSREDQLALKELAATQKEVAEQLEQLEQKLRDDSKAARELFPKAAESGEKLADAINEKMFPSLARRATGQMLAGNGVRSFGMADRLKTEMEKLFGECQGGNCPSRDELDSYLKLQRSLHPGRNFAQMARSRKFGRGRQDGFGIGMGEGASGRSGSASMNAPVDVMGNERSASRSSATARQSSRYGKGAGTLAGNAATGTPGQPDVIKGLNATNRHSAAVASEAGMEEYSDLVDHYFKALTTRKKP